MAKSKTIEKTAEKCVKTLEFIKDFLDKNGYPPTVREICNNVGFKSTASAQYYLDKLEEQGEIRKGDNKNRAIEIVNKTFTTSIKDNIKSVSNDIVDDSLLVSQEMFTNLVTIPMLGNVAAGAPLFADVENDTSYTVPSDYFNCRGQMFLLNVKGESMKNIGILNGDLVLVKQQNVAKDGDVIVAQIDNNEVTLKRFYNCGSYIRLKPENDEMSDIIVTSDREFRILGLAVGLMRNKIW
ncbi:MAG: transcriptional repressor LexA [Clostridia bacterium]|nr:transcriptional repressor LexA [Clostridia bacterium]MDE6472467.1 transcriptional repressor LexA [Clostridia bacterium]